MFLDNLNFSLFFYSFGKRLSCQMSKPSWSAAAAIPEATLLKEEPDALEAVALRRAGRGTCWLGGSKHLLFF